MAVSTRFPVLRDALVSWWTTQTPLMSDVWLYGASAFYAIVMGWTSTQTAQWHWGYLVVIPFGVAAVAAYVGAHRPPRVQPLWRRWILAMTFVGVIAMPLTMEIAWHQSEPEVQVIARAGYDVGKGQVPYHFHLKDGKYVPTYAGLPAFESFFPYFPLMTVFGLTAAITHRDTGLSDVRVFITIFTCLLLAVGFALLRAPPDRKVRIFQVLVLLPTGSLSWVTGGDDMPLLALSLLTLVALQRKRVVATGLILGVAAAMKLTAWPFAVAILAVSYGRNGRHAWGRVLAVVAAVIGVTIAPYAIVGPAAFIYNVLAFPLGMAGVASPAASPLPGHLLALWWPPLRHVILPSVLLIGGWFLAGYVRRNWPLDVSRALRILATVMTVVICAATTTRPGYLIYPINFWIWAWAIEPHTNNSTDAVVLVEANSPTR